MVVKLRTSCVACCTISPSYWGSVRNVMFTFRILSAHKKWRILLKQQFQEILQIGQFCPAFLVKNNVQKGFPISEPQTWEKIHYSVVIMTKSFYQLAVWRPCLDHSLQCCRVPVRAPAALAAVKCWDCEHRLDWYVKQSLGRRGRLKDVTVRVSVQRDIS